MSGKKAGTEQVAPQLRQAGTANRLSGSLGRRGEQLFQGGGIGDAALGDSVSFNPEVARLAFEQFDLQNQAGFDRQRQDLTNRLEGLGALTGTTVADSFGQLEQNFSNQRGAIGAQATQQDINRALENRIRVTQLGGQFAESAGGLDLQSTQLSNQVAQQNFENALSIEELNRNKSGGFAGALTGGLGGAALGIGLAPFTGGASLGLLAGGGALLGAGAGAFGPAGTGGSILTGAGSILGGLGKFRTGVPGLTTKVGSNAIDDDPLDPNSGFGLLGSGKRVGGRF